VIDDRAMKLPCSHPKSQFISCRIRRRSAQLATPVDRIAGYLLFSKWVPMTLSVNGPEANDPEVLYSAMRCGLAHAYSTSSDDPNIPKRIG
jgi:hypothetical protein